MRAANLTVATLLLAVALVAQQTPGVVAFDAAADGTVWLATEAGVLHGADGRYQRHIRGLTHVGVTDIAITAAGAVWVRHPHGLARFEQGRFVAVATPAEGLELLAPSAGTLWAAGAATGVWRHGGDGWSHVAPPPVGLEGEVLSLLGEADGGIWLGGGLRVWRWDDGNWQVVPWPAAFPTPSAFSRTPAAALARGADGLFVATRRGLVHIDPQSLAATEVDDLGSVYDVVADSRGLLWVATVGGLLHGTVGDWRRWTAADGLRSSVVVDVVADAAGATVRTLSGDLDRVTATTVRPVAFDAIADPQPAAPLPGRFADVTGVTGLDIAGDGAAWGDFDGDGDLDVLSSRRGVLEQRDGRFVAVPGTIPPEGTDMAAWADLDVDGDLDILHSSFLGIVANTGAGFVRAPMTRDGVAWDAVAEVEAYSVTTDEPWDPFHKPLKVAAADLDGDGQPELWGTSGWWFEEWDVIRRFVPVDGEWAYADASGSAGLTGTGFSRDLAFADVDLDGDLDLYVACYSGPASRSYLYRNDDGAFVELAEAASVAGVGDIVITATWGDVDADGDPDLYTANQHFGNRLHLNDTTPGSVAFREVGAQAAAAGLPGLRNNEHLGAAWGEIDNDGALDLYLTLEPEGERPDVLLHHEGLDADGVPWFAPVPERLLAPGYARTAVWGDYDNDGRQDLLLSGRDRLLRNEVAAAAHWLQVRLRPAVGGGAIGATVRVEAGGRAWLQQLQPGHSWTGQSAPWRLHFGLGNAIRVDRVTVRWPSGVVDEVVGSDSDRVLVVREGDGAVSTAVAVATGAPAGAGAGPGAGLVLYPNPFNATTTVHLGAAAGSAVTLRLHDLRGALVRSWRVPPGVIRVHWDGTDDDGRPVASGVYLLRRSGPGGTGTARAVLLR